MQRPLTYILSILLGLLLAHCHPRKQSAGTGPPDRWPVMASCEHYRTPQMQKWCFEHTLTRILQQRLETDTVMRTIWPAGDTPDTLFIYVDVDTTGRLLFGGWAGHEIHEAAKAREIMAGIVQELPLVKPASRQGVPVHVRYTLPVIISGE